MGRYKIILLFIIVLAAILRFYKLGQAPASLDWDEVSMGYNAWALAETGHDEFGNSWPLTIRSFNDYKPPLYTYLLIPSIKFFGRTEFAVRFPSALAGTLTVLATYFLAKELFAVGRVDDKLKIPLLAALLIAVSPWHLQFSRIAFEANLGLFWFVIGIWLFLRSIRIKSDWFLILSTLSLGLGMMSYHSNRVLTPLMILVLLIVFRQELLDKWRKSKLSIITCGVLLSGFLLLIAYTLFYQKVGQARFMATNFISNTDGNGVLQYAKKFLGGYLDHYDLKFWFLNGDGIGRHQIPGFGLLYWWELLFFGIGFISLISPIDPIRLISRKGRHVLFSWFLLAPIAAALVKGTPSTVRSLLFLPTFQIFEAAGLVVLMKKISKIHQVGKILLVSCYLLLVTFETVFYFHQYYRHSPIEQAADWQYGYKQLVEKISNDRQKYDRVIITTAYDQPYIYVLWYGNYFPDKWVNNGEFNRHFANFEFQKIDWGSLYGRKNILVISTPDETKSQLVKWKIDYPDGRTAFNATEL